MKSHISVENLNVHLGKHHILKNINLEIPDKHITAIIGPSGCGKTTLLKTFNRLIDLDEDVTVTGKVFIDNENVFDPNVDITAIRKKMGLLLQKPFPLPMSIYGNVAYGPRIHGVKKRKILNDIVVRNLKLVGLWDEVKKRVRAPASRLSLGQQQRLCLARGLAVEPEILLGDEPTASLDPVSSRLIEDLFLEFKEQYTVVLITHSLPQAKKLADYVGFLYLGELIEFGPAKQIFENPKKELTKKYIQGMFS